MPCGFIASTAAAENVEADRPALNEADFTAVRTAVLTYIALGSNRRETNINV